jgi:UDP-N-acetylmuramoyl-L-alanyl-D-glutamate--2,6-diaminopimelate ligase
MRLQQLLDALPAERGVVRTVGASDGENVPIRGVAIDSRAVVPGDLFVALRGTQVDSHEHLAQALRLGAVALVVERVPEGLDLRGRPAVLVADSRRALAPIAARFYGHPSRELQLVGVTGTNGKTSTTYLIESMLTAAGFRTGVVGTVEIRFAGERMRSINTTPESLELQRILRAMRNRGIDTVAMEVSSHGLASGRTDECRFSVAALTNVTQDHLDFHETMDAYRDAKLRLFRDLLRPGATAVVNVDDPHAPRFEAGAREAGARVLRVARKAAPGVDIAIADAVVGLTGTTLQLQLPSGPLAVELPLLGDFNLENLLVAAGCALALDVAPDAIGHGARTCQQVPGRIERVDSNEPGAPTVLVDYAHTPDAIDKLLRTVRPLTDGRLVTVFGCGGDRDRGKRALMAEAVARWSDRIVLTSDNPRTEDPERILDDVAMGLQGREVVAPGHLDARSGSYARIADRREAIALAISIAQPQDLVVVAGKGHEDYQIIGRERLPFDDRVEARRAGRNERSSTLRNSFSPR